MTILRVTRREFVAALGSAAAWPMVAGAQHPAMPVIGFIDTQSSSGYEPFVRGLNEAGFVEHRNVIIDREVASDTDQFSEIGAALVRRNVAVICGPANAIIAAKAVTTTLPMVFIGSTDPVAAGLVASFNRPGGNVTGVRLIAGNLASKQLEIFHELMPAVTKIGLLVNPRFTDAEPRAMATEEAARVLGMTSIVERVISVNDFEGAFLRFGQEHVYAILVITNLFFGAYWTRLAELALSQNLPIVSQSQDFTRAGALASYGTSTSDVIRQAGTYVGRILKGEKPADLPVLQ